MSNKDKKVEKLARLAADGENTIVYAINLDFLSNKEIERYEKKRILLFVGYRDETTCSECIKGSCTVPVKRVKYPDGRKMGVYRCPDPDHGGRFEIELDKLRYWKINIEVLKEMGYLTEPKKTSAKRKTKKAEESEKKFQPWVKSGDACFILKNSRIIFHYKNDDKDLKLSHSSRAYKLLYLYLAKNPLPQREINELCTKNTRPSDIAKVTNETLNKKIAAFELSNIPKDIAFVKFDVESRCYGLHPKIIYSDADEIL